MSEPAAAYHSAAPSSGSPELLRELRLVDSTTLVIGSMIGSGIFIVSADAARLLSSPGLLILAWILTAGLTVIGALCYSELAAAMPQAGGPYVYLREAFGPVFGFLYGWTTFLVIQTGSIAAVAVAFAKFLGILVPSISSSNTVVAWVSTEQLTAILSIAVLTLLNCFGIRLGAWVQNIFTFTKTAALLALVLLVFFLGSNYQGFAVNFGDFWRNAGWSLDTMTLLGVAMVGPLFAYDAWYGVTFTGAEIKNPRRNLPLSMIVGVGTVSVLYILINFVYLGLLPLEGSPEGAGPIARGIQYASEDRVGTAAAQVIFGPEGVGLMALAIMISVFGCNNGLILSGARVYYAMARDNLFFSAAGRVHPRYHTPVISLVVQGVWASVLTLSGTYSQLLDYIIFAVLLFLMLAITGLFVLRRKRPEMERPYRAWGYPVLPALYLVLSGFIAVNLLIYKPEYTWPGLIIVLLGLPVYCLWRRLPGTQSVKR